MTAMGSAIRLWARTELRNRWRTLVVLGIVAGLAGGLVLAAVAGSRRTATAFDRYREATAAPDAIVFGTQVNLIGADYRAVMALPEVIAGGEFTLAPVVINEPRLTTLTPGDTQLYRTVARPLLTSGRLPNPSRDDEVVINKAASKRYGLEVGDKVTIATSTDIEQFFTGEVSGGREIIATIVGVGDSMIDQIFLSGKDPEPGFIPSGGLLVGSPDIPRAGNLVVRLRPGTDVDAFRVRAQEAIRATNREALEKKMALGAEIPVRDIAEDRKRFVHGTDLERTSLLLFASAAALAGLVLVGQAIARTVYAVGEALPPLRALGFTRRAAVGGLVAPLLLTAAVATLVSVGTALALSSRFPIGLAAELDPDLGFHVDWLVLAPGAVLVGLAVVGGATAAAIRAAWTEPRESTSVQPAFVRAIRNTAPLPIAIGAGLALDAGRGQRSVPVRPALAGAVAGVLGIVGALGLVRGIDDAVADPSRSGQTWDATVAFQEQDARSKDEITQAVMENPKVTAVARAFRQPVDVDGAGVPAYSLAAMRGEISFVVLEGRGPLAPDEIALAPSTATAIGKGIGDHVTVGSRRLRVVGEVLLQQTAHSSFDQGAWLTPDGLRQIVGEGASEEILVRGNGVDPNALAGELSELGVYTEPSSIPQDVFLLRNVRTLPRALAAFLVLLGVAALGHALVTTVRRRRHDFAVLRALGMRPGQTRAVIAWQATTVGFVALLLGIPLGIAAGRVSWRWVAESTPLLYVAPIAVAAILLAIPGALLMANALAALPARRAGRIRPAVVLRTE